MPSGDLLGQAVNRGGGPVEEPVGEARVLVAVMNNARDFALAREEGWYRIPVSRAPARIGADYLAFYHTAAFAREKWHVCYYAPVLGYRIMSRVELLPGEPDHPRAADKYYCLRLGALRELPRPIPSLRLRRVTFISTTLERLLAAREINDLWEPRCPAEHLWAVFRPGAARVKGERAALEGAAGYAVVSAVPRLAPRRRAPTGRVRPVVRLHPLCASAPGDGSVWAVAAQPQPAAVGLVPSECGTGGGPAGGHSDPRAASTSWAMRRERIRRRMVSMWGYMTTSSPRKGTCSLISE